MEFEIYPYIRKFYSMKYAYACLYNLYHWFTLSTNVKAYSLDDKSHFKTLVDKKGVRYATETYNRSKTKLCLYSDNDGYVVDITETQLYDEVRKAYSKDFLMSLFNNINLNGYKNFANQLNCYLFLDKIKNELFKNIKYEFNISFYDKNLENHQLKEVLYKQIDAFLSTFDDIDKDYIEITHKNIVFKKIKV